VDFMLYEYNALQVKLPELITSFNMSYSPNLKWNEDIWFSTPLIGCKMEKEDFNSEYLNLFVDNANMKYDDLTVNFYITTKSVNAVHIDLDTGCGPGDLICSLPYPYWFTNGSLIVEIDIDQPAKWVLFNIEGGDNGTYIYTDEFLEKHLTIKYEIGNFPTNGVYHNFTNDVDIGRLRYYVDKPKFGKMYAEFRFNYDKPMRLLMSIVLNKEVDNVVKLNRNDELELKFKSGDEINVYLNADMESKVLALYSTNYGTYNISVGFGSPFDQTCEYGIFYHMGLYKVGPFMDYNGIFVKIHNVGLINDVVNIRLENYCYPECQYGKCIDNICVCDEGWRGNLCQYPFDNSDDGNDSDSDSYGYDSYDNGVNWISIVIMMLIGGIILWCLYTLLVDIMMCKRINRNKEMIPLKTFDNEFESKNETNDEEIKGLKYKIILSLVTIIIALIIFMIHIMVIDMSYELIVLIAITLLIVAHIIIRKILWDKTGSY